MAYITLTPEWILMNLTTGRTCNSNGIATLYTIHIDYSRLIDIALESYIDSFVVNDEIPEYLGIRYDFRLSEIKDRCPVLWQELEDIRLGP
jgi:hypothetical protein